MSVPPEVNEEFEAALKEKNQTKSEFFRDMFRSYKLSQENPESLSMDEALKAYWNARSSSTEKIILITLGIIVRDGKVLIGARTGKDRWIDNLTWVFPGGEIRSLDFAEETKREVKEETGLDVDVHTLVSSRIHPDSGLKPVHIVAFYFYCTPTDSKAKPVPTGELSEFKWVRPQDIFTYFTGSTSDEVTRFLMTMKS